MDNRKVSFGEIIKPHCQRTKQHAQSGVWLSICDTTEISFRPRRTIEGLRPVGNGTGQGFFLHTALLVSDSSQEIVGIAAQELFYRIDSRKNENTAKRKQRERESEVWGRVVNAIGRPNKDAQIIHVCDREADDFDFYCHLVQNQVGWIVRACRLNRKVYRADCENSPLTKDQQVSLESILETLSLLGTYELWVKGHKKQQARMAKLQVRSTKVLIPRPLASSKWAKENGPDYIPMGVVEVREVNAPSAIEPLRWVLYTNENLSSFEDCWKTIERYEKRPLIEEYHKAAKMGAQIEERLYRTAARQERIVAILAIVAIRILQMKSIASIDPTRLAKSFAPRKWVSVLCKIQRQQQPKKRKVYQPDTITARDFIRGVAMLGGFLARKHDGEPGWTTIWRGVKELLLILRLTKHKSNTKTNETYG